ncbi:MAG: DUF4430 domain-containing protein [Candidatus Jordarchaeales archaeon]
MNGYKKFTPPFTAEKDIFLGKLTYKQNFPAGENEMAQASVKAVALALTVIVAASFGAAGYLYYQNNAAQQQQRLMLAAILQHDLTHVTVIINYGNGTIESHTVKYTPGMTALQALDEVAEFDGRYYEFDGTPSFYITVINGVREGDREGYFWLYYVKHYFSLSIELPLVGVDKCLLSGGDTVLFVYTNVFPFS